MSNHAQYLFELIWNCNFALNTGINIMYSSFSVVFQVVGHKDNSSLVFFRADIKGFTFSRFTTPSSLKLSIHEDSSSTKFSDKESKNIHIDRLHIIRNTPLRDSWAPFEVRALVDWVSGLVNRNNRCFRLQFSCWRVQGSRVKSTTLTVHRKIATQITVSIKLHGYCASIHGLPLPKQQQLSALCKLQYCYTDCQ